MKPDFEKEYVKLNLAQKQAVDSIDGPVAVIAGPGTGKTQLLSMRVANILKLTDTSPSNILCLTFTESAAENIRYRLASLIGRDANHVDILTFHGFGRQIIQNYPEYFEEKPLLKHLNELGQFEVIQSLMGRLHHDNPLSRKVGDRFLHLTTLTSALSWFKQAGLNPNDLRIEAIKSRTFFKNSNKFLNAAFQDSPSAKNKTLYLDLLKSLNSLKQKQPSIFAKNATEELELAISEISDRSRFAKPITGWRNKWTAQIKPGKWQFVDENRNNFLIQVANLYEDYETYLEDRGLFTYDDMILRSVNAIELNLDLKLLLQERYQYILVDEYQDTNGAQNKLLTLLGDNIINENRPNIMIVGDDDQAIYRFQGAESSIISEFISHWSSTKIIVLKDSYRSGQGLLDLSRNIILNAQDRLESVSSEFTKVLRSSGNINTTKIINLKTNTEAENYIYVAETVNKLIRSGINPSSIAIISPKHRYLKALVPYFISEAIPINYEQREQILDQPRIVEILDLIRLVWAASNAKTATVDALLPRVLASPYFQLSTNVWWEIAILSQKNRQGWLNAIETYGSPILNDFAQVIKKLGKDSNNQQFNLTLAYLMGNRPLQLDNGQNFYMPWRDYYFNEQAVKNETSDYLKFMGQLKTLLNYFNEWQSDLKKFVTISDFYTFIEIYKASNLPLLDESPYMSAVDAICLTTVYKAKGLEWDYVFVLNCHDDVWGPKTRNRNLTFKLPMGLRWIEPARTNSDDLVRLFYVAITRARKALYLTSFNFKDNGVAVTKLEWLPTADDPEILEKTPMIKPLSVISSFNDYWTNLYKSPTNDLRVILGPILDRYKLSATHLNDFLSVDKGGPNYFLYKSILKIPELLSPNTLYGQAIHKTLECIHKQLNKEKTLPTIESINNFFIEELKTYPLTSSEYKFLKKRGIDNLAIWFDINKPLFQSDDISEHNFSGENIILDKARLTGKVDVIRPKSKNEMLVIDYKTSQPIYSWKSNSGSNAIKSHTYQNQLMFYRLLLNNSKTYSKFDVTKGQVNFISPGSDNQIVSLDYLYNEDDLKRFNKLVEQVWNKIIDLDLPDISKYTPNISGIKKFEDDLIEGNI